MCKIFNNKVNKKMIGTYDSCQEILSEQSESPPNKVKDLAAWFC